MIGDPLCIQAAADLALAGGTVALVMLLVVGIPFVCTFWDEIRCRITGRHRMRTAEFHTCGLPDSHRRRFAS